MSIDKEDIKAVGYGIFGVVTVGVVMLALAAVALFVIVFGLRAIIANSTSWLDFVVWTGLSGLAFTVVAKFIINKLKEWTSNDTLESVSVPTQSPVPTCEDSTVEEVPVPHKLEPKYIVKGLDEKKKSVARVKLSDGYM